MFKHIFVYKGIEHSKYLEDYATKRVAKILKYIEDSSKITISFELKGKESICTIGVNNKLYHKSKQSTESMYDAIDKCVLSLKNSLAKDKGKQLAKLRKNLSDRYAIVEVTEENEY